MWETFQRTKKSSSKDPTVTLGKGGVIGLNVAVCRNIVSDNRFAYLLFDKDRGFMGIKFTKKEDPDAYPVKITESRGHASLTGVSFLKTYDIYPAETKVYPATFDEKDKILVVDLNAEDVRIAKKKARP